MPLQIMLRLVCRMSSFNFVMLLSSFQIAFRAYFEPVRMAAAADGSFRCLFTIKMSGASAHEGAAVDVYTW